jgi:hypothetical protein
MKEIHMKKRENESIGIEVGSEGDRVADLVPQRSASFCEAGFRSALE